MISKNSRKTLFSFTGLLISTALFGCSPSSSNSSGGVPLTVSPAMTVMTGQINASFGTAGYGSTIFGTTSSAFGLGTQSTGSFILLFQNTSTPSNTNESFYLARFLPSGVIDTTFGTQGQVEFQCSFACTGSKVVIETDDKILVVANTILPSSSFFTVVRYNSNGSLDTTYGSSGVTATSNGTITAAYIDPTTDNLVLAGVITSPSASTFIERLLPTGVLDTTFNGTGSVSVSGRESKLRRALSTAFLTDYLAGATVGASYLLGAVTSAGVLDPNLGTQGYVSSVTSSAVTAIAVQAGGQIVLGASAGTNFQIVRLLANGQSDTSFATAGVLTVPSGDTSTGAVNQILLDQQGNIIVVYNGTTVVAPSTTSQTNLTVFRFTTAGVLDTTFASTGSLSVPFEAASGGVLSGGGDLALAVSGAGGAQILEIQ